MVKEIGSTVKEMRSTVKEMRSWELVGGQRHEGADAASFYGI